MKYTEGTWNGFPKYTCLYCAYNTLSQEKIAWHVSRRHADEPEPEDAPQIEEKTNGTD